MKNWSDWRAVLFATIALMQSAPALSQELSKPGEGGNMDSGKEEFESNCASCHSVKKGEGSIAPNLSGVFGRLSGTHPNFNYTAALHNKRILWNAANLDAYLKDSEKKVPGTAMGINIDDSKERADIIAYLRSLGPPDPSPESFTKKKTPLMSGPTQAELDAANASKGWLLTNKGYNATRYSSLDQINQNNAGDLRPICVYQSGVSGSHETFPVVYNGVIFVTSGSSTAAVDAKTCKQLWLTDHNLKGNIRSLNRGAAIAKGRLVRATPDGRVVALNMKDGSLVWENKVTGKEESAFFAQPPMIWNDLVFIGPAGSDWGLKGWVAAFNLEDGKEVWRFNNIPDEDEPGIETWKNKEMAKYGGGGVWTAMAFDAEKELLIVPIGNPAPDWNPDARPGDNLYTGSVVALHAQTGKLAWYKQFVTNDGHDYDLTAARPLITGEIEGKKRNLLVITGKDGILRLMDRDTRDVLYESPFVTQKNVDKPIVPEGVSVCPGSVGGSQWAGAAYNPDSSTIFIGGVELCGIYKSGKPEASPGTGKGYFGGQFIPGNNGKAHGRLSAFEAFTGKLKWQQEWDTPVVAGLTATKGGLLITGKTTGELLVLDQDTGNTLYSFSSGGGFGTGPVTYELDGKQYIAAVSGVVSPYFAGRGSMQVIIFDVGAYKAK